MGVVGRHHAQDRKYFDSGDYALSKAGKAPQSTVGTAIPNPEKCVTAIHVIIRSVVDPDALL